MVGRHGWLLTFVSFRYSLQVPQLFSPGNSRHLGGWMGLLFDLNLVAKRRISARYGNRKVLRPSSQQPSHCTDWATGYKCTILGGTRHCLTVQELPLLATWLLHPIFPSIKRWKVLPLPPYKSGCRILGTMMIIMTMISRSKPSVFSDWENSSGDPNFRMRSRGRREVSSGHCFRRLPATLQRELRSYA